MPVPPPVHIEPVSQVRLGGQQGRPGLPQAKQVPAPLKKQPVPVAVQMRPAQQGWFIPPQVWQRLSKPQPSVAPHMRLAQQGWPSPPQVWQVLDPVGPAHTVPPAEQVPPAQQGWLTAPHSSQVPGVPLHTVPAV
jgi:hypothetical protein